MQRQQIISFLSSDLASYLLYEAGPKVCESGLCIKKSRQRSLGAYTGWICEYTGWICEYTGWICEYTGCTYPRISR